MIDWFSLWAGTIIGMSFSVLVIAWAFTAIRNDPAAREATRHFLDAKGKP